LLAASKNSTLPVKMMLEGSRPTLAFVDNSAPAYWLYDSSLKAPTGGFLFGLYEQMAIRGGFKWNYTLTPEQGTASDDDYLLSICTKYDTVAKTSFDTLVRRTEGLSFSPALLEASLVLIIDKNVFSTMQVSRMLSWLYPFSSELWGAIIAAISFHALLQWMIDKTPKACRNIQGLLKGIWSQCQKAPAYHKKMKKTLSQKSFSLKSFNKKKAGIEDEKNANENTEQGIEEVKVFQNPRRRRTKRNKTPSFDTYLYQSFSSFTNTDGHAPQTRSGKALYLVFGLFILICISSYTANLASVLISVGKHTLPIQSITQANNLGAQVCFRKGAAAISLTTSVYKNIQVVQTDTPDNNKVLQMLQDGKCQAAVLAYNDWQVAGQLTINNAACNLQIVGPVIRHMNVYLPFLVDFNQECTSFFGNVFSALLTELSQNYIVDQLWTSTLHTYQEVDCSAMSASASYSSSSQLTLFGMCGLFAYYAGWCGFILFCHVIKQLAIVYNLWPWIHEHEDSCNENLAPLN